MTGTAFGRYLLLDQIGEGGMGVVYAASDPELGRKVAVKVVRLDRDADSAVAQARLLREAQAMARVSHPNVVAVHDVGTVDGQVFLAMELVDGATLAEWLRARPRRPWRQALAILAQAGQGLAAAHRAGIVHRDFKPQNVLIGADGRVCVTDFGLARAGEEAAALTTTSGSASPCGTLTQTGALLGTPAYMSPEQQGGLPADARSDQFSFCVAAYEALYGERPFAPLPGSNLSTTLGLAAAMRAGRTRPPPPGTRVPARLGRVLARGLAVDPAARHPSMAALLAELTRDPWARRRLWAGAALLAAATAAGVWTLRPAAPSPCQGARAALGDLWSAPRRQALAAAFAGQPAVWARVEPALARLASDWQEVHTGVCEATHVYRHQSTAVLDRRMECLADQRRIVQALEEVWLAGDTKVRGQAREAVLALPAPRDCASDALLKAAGLSEPRDAETKVKVAALRGSLAQVAALIIAGDGPRAHLLAQGLAVAARALGHPPLEAEALLELGRAADIHGAPAEAEATCRDAILAAVGAHHELVLSRAMSFLVWLVGVELGRSEEGKRLAAQALAVAQRLGDDKRAADVAYYRAIIGGPDAQERLEAALRQSIAAYGPETRRVGDVYNVMAVVARGLGHFDEARGELERSIAVLERVLGPDHPELATPLHTLAEILGTDLADYAPARALAERTLALARKTQGWHVGVALHQLAGLDFAEGNAAGALAREQAALAVLEQHLGPVHYHIAAAQYALGMMHLELGDAREAARLLEKSAATRRANRPPEELNAALADCALGLARIRAGEPGLALARAGCAGAEARTRPGSRSRAIGELLLCAALGESGHEAEAEEHCRLAANIYGGFYGPDHPRALEARIYSATNLRRLHRDSEALPVLEQAAAILERRHDNPHLLARARRALAQP